MYEFIEFYPRPHYEILWSWLREHIEFYKPERNWVWVTEYAFSLLSNHVWVRPLGAVVDLDGAGEVALVFEFVTQPMAVEWQLLA